jgi:hypothetical protein
MHMGLLSHGITFERGVSSPQGLASGGVAFGATSIKAANACLYSSYEKAVYW